jgi:hypothetical protein
MVGTFDWHVQTEHVLFGRSFRTNVLSRSRKAREKNNNSTAWERSLALPHEQTVQHCFKRVCAVRFHDLDSQLPVQITNHLDARADGLLPCRLFDFMKQDLARCVAPERPKKEDNPWETLGRKLSPLLLTFG